MVSQWQGTATAVATPARPAGIRDWRRWAPYGAVAWSVAYGVLGIYWALGGRGFPYRPPAVSGTVADAFQPLLGRFGPGAAWVVVVMAGMPAAALGAAMLRGVRGSAVRPLFVSAGTLLSAVLLFLMTGLSLLIAFGYIPYAIRSLLTGAPFVRTFLKGLGEWTLVHQLLCLAGGFLWLAATVSYGRISGNACVYCGRHEGSEGWRGRIEAARWGRIAVYVSMAAPIFYAFTRYAWALGFPLGMSDEAFHRGQERGTWIAGLFLANFGLVGIPLTLGLVQRWGEAFPRWMVGLARRRVPVSLAVVPASFVAVLLVVGGIAIWSALDRMVAMMAIAGRKQMEITTEVFFAVGPTLLFPVWGAALAVATLAYYYRRRAACGVCGRGVL